jgi:hypothetical protein
MRTMPQVEVTTLLRAAGYPGPERIAVTGGVFALVDGPDDEKTQHLLAGLVILVLTSSNYERRQLADGVQAVTAHAGERFMRFMVFDAQDSSGNPIKAVTTLAEHWAYERAEKGENVDTIPGERRWLQ